jgi:lipoprotein-releasing system ATP-binding protein
MLKARDIRKKYGEVEVLKGIDLEIFQGEVVSIVGASGAGKSTLLQILGSLEKPDSGEVLFDDREITRMGKKELARFRNLHIGFVFQFHHLLPEFTALENVCIPAFIAGKSKEESEATASVLLERLGLGHRLRHKPSELSGGEQQRVAVARALVNSPKVIFADEPTGNLDSKNARELHQLFFELRSEMGHTFVIVTHNEDLAELSDRRLEMADGKLLV